MCRDVAILSIFTVPVFARCTCRIRTFSSSAAGMEDNILGKHCLRPPPPVDEGGPPEAIKGGGNFHVVSLQHRNELVAQPFFGVPFWFFMFLHSRVMRLRYCLNPPEKKIHAGSVSRRQYHIVIVLPNAGAIGVDFGALYTALESI